METTFSVRIILIFASIFALVCELISLLGHGWLEFSFTFVINNVTVTQTMTQGLFYVSPYIICLDPGNGTTCKTIDEFPPALGSKLEVLSKALNENLEVPRALAIIGLILLVSSIFLLYGYICMTKKCTSDKCIGITCAVLFAIAAIVNLTCTGIQFSRKREADKAFNTIAEVYKMNGMKFEGYLSFPWAVLVLGIGALCELVAGFVVAMTSCGKQYNKTVIIYKELKDKEHLLDNHDDV